MRIIRVLGVLEPGGAQLSALRLARAQAALGVETRLIACDATPQGVGLARHFGFDPAVLHMHDQVDHSAGQWTPDDAFARWLIPLVQSADLVHAHMFGAWWAAARSTPPGVPVVASEHNSVTWPLGDHSQSAADAANRVDAFFVHGPGPEAFVRSLGVHPADVLPGRSAIAVHTTPRPGLRWPRLTFTGRLREDKGPDLLLHAIAELKDPPVTYLIGDGPMQRDVRLLVEQLGLARSVHLTGWSHQPARYVAGAALHVVPSREESWSQSAVTAMALGVPVVACAVDGLPVTLAQRRGLLVAPNAEAIAAGIQLVLDGTAGIDRAGARRYAATYEPAQIASEYFAVYQRLLQNAAAAHVGDEGTASLAGTKS